MSRHGAVPSSGGCEPRDPWHEASEPAAGRRCERTPAGPPDAARRPTEASVWATTPRPAEPDGRGRSTPSRCRRPSRSPRTILDAELDDSAADRAVRSRPARAPSRPDRPAGRGRRSASDAARTRVPSRRRPSPRPSRRPPRTPGAQPVRPAAAPGHGHRQPEGRRREDHDGREPGGLPGRHRLPGAGRRSGSPGQRQHRPGRQHPGPAGLDVRRGPARPADRGLRRGHVGQEPLLRPVVAGAGRRRDRARARVQPGAAAQAGPRRGAGRLRLRPHRLPAVARPAHGQRLRRRHRGGGADPVRVLRAGGPGPAAAQRQPGPEEPEPGPGADAPSSW